MFGTKTTKKPYCRCLDESRRGVERTQHCFMPCDDQREIIRLETEAMIIADPEKLEAHIELLERNLSLVTQANTPGKSKLVDAWIKRDEKELARFKSYRSREVILADPIKLQAHIAQLEQQLNELKTNPPSSHSAVLLHVMEKELEETIGEWKSHLPKTA